MSNTLLTASAVTREALRVLHQKLRLNASIRWMREPAER